ncbi:hypothetical protein NBM05_01010 [Rothia sp. AR01]|uniref:Uncharacterized protein n=1 Tax=Rothia santali TaxID=2949643 RepID=A0A9X2HAK3_9MICC|nr:hypothetical protein [Rothia santali]MCP3424650.1 hypothetical protein [Rothia santali]
MIDTDLHLSPQHDSPIEYLRISREIALEIHRAGLPLRERMSVAIGEEYAAILIEPDGEGILVTAGSWGIGGFEAFENKEPLRIDGVDLSEVDRLAVEVSEKVFYAILGQ